MAETRTSHLKAQLTKKLRKRDKKTLEELGRELGVTRQALALPARELCDEGVAAKHKGKPPSYTKA